ncbi:MAG: hypothetical protein KKC85_06175 [Gammaproteobacteria bacterium]|nr:hypothetical protein [Gammaproteobacteria bacterium]
MRRYSFDAQGRLAAVTTGASDTAPTTRYAHNALGQRVFKTEPIYAPMQGEPSTTSSPGFMQSLLAFFGQTLSASTLTDAERLGFAFIYDEDGSLIAETGTGGANSTGSLQHIYLPTVGGAMPIALISNGQLYAVQSDHLNTPRKLVNADGLAVWQWKYSGFGEDQPTTLATRFADPERTPNAGTVNISVPNYNLRYAGQYFDVESGLNYNRFRSYKPGLGYTQNDPIGLLGGMNRKTALENNPLMFSDPMGLDAWGSYGYGRYLPATNPDPSFWERLNFPETPEQRAAGENIALGFCGSTISGAGRGSAALWSANKRMSALENALGHWNKHRAEFPELANAKQYVEAARELATNPPATALTKARGADKLIYDPATNTFLSSGASGAPRTMFRPADGANYWSRQ